MNRKDAAREQEVLEIYYTLINISPRKTKQDGKSTYGVDWLQKAYDIIPQSWKIHYFIMYKISGEVIKFIENTIEKWRVKLTVGGKSLTEVKIHWEMFQGDVLSPLLFVIAMMPLKYILRKCTSGYKLHKLQEKSTTKYTWTTSKNDKRSETLIQTVRIYSQDIGIEFSIEKCATLIMKCRKQQRNQ